MLKKHNKLVMIIVLLTFMFSIVASAGAVQFKDVTGNDTEAAAIYKLVALGVLEGYPDGSFKPDNTITRAEFAKIADVVAGLKAVAGGMKGTPSVFSDVTADHWANGWINVAAAQSYVKGDPIGTYRPADQVNMAEVVTVLLRILGYNDNLSGEWPSDYIAKAANLGVLDDVTFVANKAATRGEVAILVSSVLEEFVVDYQASDNLFQFKEDSDDEPISLLYDKFDDAKMVEDALVYCVNVADDDFELVYRESDDDWKLSKKEYKITLTDDAVVVGGRCAVDCAMRFVDFIENDDGDAVYVEIQDYGVIATDEIETKNLREPTGNLFNDDKSPKLATEIENTDTGNEYDFAPDVLWSPSSSSFGGPIMQWVAAENDSADRYELVLNDDGDVSAVKVATMAAPGIVDDVNVDKERITFKVNPEECLTGLGTSWGDNIPNLEDEDYFVYKNGFPATLADINEDDAVWVLTGQDNYEEGGYCGVDYYIAVVGSEFGRITGTLESVKSRSDETVSKITVDGKTYKVVDSLNYDNNFGSVTIDSAQPTIVDAREELAKGTMVYVTDSSHPLYPYNGKPYGMLQKKGDMRVVPYLSVDGGEDFEDLDKADDITGDGDYNLLGEEVTLVMSPVGKVGAIISDTEGEDGGSKAYAVVIAKHPQKYYEGELCDLLKVYSLNQGKEVTYAIDDDGKYRDVESESNGKYKYKAYSDEGKVYANVNEGDFVYFTLTRDGKVNNLTKLAKGSLTDDLFDNWTGVSQFDVSAVDEDIDTIKINGKWYEAEDAKFANIEGNDLEEIEDVSFKDVIDHIDSVSDSVEMAYYVDDNKLKYAAIHVASLVSDFDVAVVKSHATDGDGVYVKLVEGEEYQKYYVTDSSEDDVKELGSGDVLIIQWDAGEVDIDDVVDGPVVDLAYEVSLTDVNNNSVVGSIYNGASMSFLIDSDTRFFDVTDTDEPVEVDKKGISKGDSVLVVLDKGEIISDRLDEPVKGIILLED